MADISDLFLSILAMDAYNRTSNYRMGRRRLFSLVLPNGSGLGSQLGDARVTEVLGLIAG
jgi:hypothetical protein